MKKIIVSLTIILCGVSIQSIGQCGKKITLTSSKTEYLDTAGNVTRSVDEKSIIEIKEKEIMIAPGQNPPMTGSVAVESCTWSKAFKEGRSVYSAHFEEPDKQARNITITIEGKDGKLTFIAQVKEQPNKIIRLSLDTFAESK